MAGTFPIYCTFDSLVTPPVFTIPLVGCVVVSRWVALLALDGAVDLIVEFVDSFLEIGMESVEAGIDPGFEPRQPARCGLASPSPMRILFMISILGYRA